MSAAEALAAGWKAHQAGDLRTAERTYRAVLARQPRNASAWCYLGMACHDQRRSEEAETAYRRAVRLQPDFAVAWSNLGNTLLALHREEEALPAYARAVEIDPQYVNAWNNRGSALLLLGRFAEAIDAFGQALRIRPDDAATHTNRALALLLHGRYREGFAEYEWRLQNPACLRSMPVGPRWDGSPLAGRTLLLEAEQGLGDAIHFVRYAAEIKRRHQGRIAVACHPPLLPLLAGVAGVDRLVGQDGERPPFDVWAPLLSLPGLMEHDLATFPGEVPYLAAEPGRVARWRERLEAVGGVRIGIAWQGGRANLMDRRRSIPLAAFAPLAALQGVRLVSLQKGPGTEQLDTLTAFDVVAPGDDLDADGAFLDTAAVMPALDLVVTADTSIAHLAGALGVPVWLALAHVPDWRWTPHGDRTPWYPTMRLFRQPRSGDWAGVFEAMAAALRAERPVLRRRRPEEYRLATSGFNRLARTRHGLALFNRHDAYVGRSLGELGEFSEGEVELFRQLLRPGATVVEAGANIGAHTVPLGRLVGRRGAVHAIEPQRVVFQTLCANVALASLANVHAHHAAAGAEPGWVTVPSLDFDRPNNFGGLSLGAHPHGERVPVMTIDGLELRRCDLVKIDVEGMELAVLRGAVETIRARRPLVYVENDRGDRSPALIEALLALGYRLYWHLPPYYRRDNYYGNADNPFGGLVSVNVLGVHASVKANIQGLRPIEGPASDWRRPG
jgi:FkbM family methyltransferase